MNRTMIAACAAMVLAGSLTACGTATPKSSMNDPGMTRSGNQQMMHNGRYRAYPDGRVYPGRETQIARDAKDLGKDVADGTKDLGKDIVDDTKDLGKDIADGAKDIGKDVADGARDIGRDVADGARDIGRGTEDTLQRMHEPGKRPG